MEPRWAPTTNMGYDFETFVSDPNNLFKKTLDPIDKEPVQPDAFRRTTVQGIQFKNETGSIIWAIDAPVLKHENANKKCDEKLDKSEHEWK